jgi:hypothetical protein
MNDLFEATGLGAATTTEASASYQPVFRFAMERANEGLDTLVYKLLKARPETRRVYAFMVMGDFVPGEDIEIRTVVTDEHPGRDCCALVIDEDTRAEFICRYEQGDDDE